MAAPSNLTDSDKLQQLWDKEQIREVVARYCRGVDRFEEELAKSIYLPRSTEDHGVYLGDGRKMIDFLRYLKDTDYVGHHSLGQSLVELNGDTANCETYFVCGIAQTYDKDTHKSFVDLRGRYLDTLERVPGGWQVANRVAVMDLTYQRPLDPAWNIAQAFIQGKRYPDDLVYHPNKYAERVPPN